MYTGKLAHAARRVFIKPDNDQTDNKQLFNFDEFHALYQVMEKHKRLGHVASWKYMTIDDASILYVSNNIPREDCLMTIHKTKNGNGPYEYSLHSRFGCVHLTTYNFKNILEEAGRILSDLPVYGKPAIALAGA